MGHYRKDPDLEFLQLAEEDDLRVLTHYLTHDEKGEIRWTESLTSDSLYKDNADKPDRHKKCWQRIAAELQHFGGDSIVNKFRRKGVLYREIIADICSKQNIKLKQYFKVDEAEGRLLKHITKEAMKKMSEEEKVDFLNELGIDSSMSGALEDFLTKMVSGSAATVLLSSIIAKIVARQLAVSAAAQVAGQVGSRGLLAFAGPIGIAFGTLLLIPSITGSAYRVTLPAAIQIAYMRQKGLSQNYF